MSDSMRILLPSDVFPPRCGGAGWSAHALASALLERGHAVTAIVPRLEHGSRIREATRSYAKKALFFALLRAPSRIEICAADDLTDVLEAPGLLREEVLGVPTLRWGYRAPRFPFVQNYFRHERLWPRLAELLVAEGQMAGGPARVGPRAPLLIHAQHVQVTPPAIMAGRQLGVPVVVTVRDHWPWDYFATGLHGDQLPYPRQTWAALATDLVARLGPGRGALALLAIPYMLAHVQRRQRFLRQADAVIAVSSYIAHRLEGIVAPERVHVIPNMIDTAAIAATSAAAPASVAPGTAYLLFVGKLERNKGAHLLVEIFRELRAHQPALPELVIAGDGALRPALERDLAELGVRTRFLDWIDHDEVLRLMAHCALLLFPSAWGEPLSRIVLEGMACGAPILAMPTGGTAGSISDGITGALEQTAAGFARRMAALLEQPDRRLALGVAARRAARDRYDKAVVVAQVEALYRALMEG